MPGIKINKDSNGRIKVSFQYNPAYIAKIKTIKGYKWHIPYYELEGLLSVFVGEKLDIDPSVWLDKLHIYWRAGRTCGIFRNCLGIKGCIYEISFGYHFDLYGYTTLMSDIMKLGEIAF